MPGNSSGRDRGRGRSGTAAGTAPRPEGCSRARRRRTGAGMTGSGGRGICASQRRAAPTRAALLPPLGMLLSVMSGVSDRMSRRGRSWLSIGAAGGRRGQLPASPCAASRPSRPATCRRWALRAGRSGVLPARPSVSTGTAMRGAVRPGRPPLAAGGSRCGRCAPVVAFRHAAVSPAGALGPAGGGSMTGG
jgi:hypothetical protein